MLFRVANFRSPVEMAEAELPSRVCQKLGLQQTELQSWKILRKSLDARQRHALQFVYSLILDVPDSQQP